MTKVSQYRPFNITPGVQPSTDKTNLATQHWTAAQGIRFVDGQPQKIGGCQKIALYNGATVNGKVRSIFSMEFNDVDEAVVGTNTNVYALIGNHLTNITPFVTTSTTIGNVLSTDYSTLASNPIRTSFNSTSVRVYDANWQKYRVGDSITLSGATAVANRTAASINATHVIRTINGSGYWTYNSALAASSTATGGGNAVVRSSGIIRVTTANTQSEGNRVKIINATDTGGITAAQLNGEFVIRNVTPTYFDYVTMGVATSSATGGGATTAYYSQIASGNADEISTDGYGAGLYGVGLYGTDLISMSGRVYPRIWFFDRYGNTTIMTAGNQTGVYQWSGLATASPVFVANAPTAVNYAFISDNVLVTLGAGGAENHIFASDQGNITNWTASSSNDVYEIFVQGAGRFLSHAPAEATNLLFTGYQTYTFRFIGGTSIWELKQLDSAIGIIAAMARCSVQGIPYWMGENNFYFYRGGSVEIIPANSQSQSTLHNYVFGNINKSQKSKCFAWYNPIYSEVWFHYPSAASNECDSIARLNIRDYTWTPDKMDRTAAEYPNISDYPRMSDQSSNLFYQEVGMDYDIASLPFSLTGPLNPAGKTTGTVVGIIPDSIQSGNINVSLSAKLYPQSAAFTNVGNYTITPTTQNVETQVSGRFHQYTISGNALGQSWRMGQWFDDFQPAAER